MLPGTVSVLWLWRSYDIKIAFPEKTKPNLSSKQWGLLVTTTAWAAADNFHEVEGGREEPVKAWGKPRPAVVSFAASYLIIILRKRSLL